MDSSRSFNLPKVLGSTAVLFPNPFRREDINCLVSLIESSNIT